MAIMATDGRTHHYQSVRAEERDEIDGLDAHVGETIDLDEKDYIQGPVRSRRTRAFGVLRRFRWLIDGVLLAFILMLLADRQWAVKREEKQTQLEGTGDVTGFAPQCRWSLLFTSTKS